MEYVQYYIACPLCGFLHILGRNLTEVNLNELGFNKPNKKPHKFACGCEFVSSSEHLRHRTIKKKPPIATRHYGIPLNELNTLRLRRAEDETRKQRAT